MVVIGVQQAVRAQRVQAQVRGQVNQVVLVAIAQLAIALLLGPQQAIDLEH
jgi:hypothetical protein